MTGGNLIKTEKDQTKLIRLIYENQYEGRCLMEYPLKDTERVIGEVLPYLKIRGAVEIGDELRKRLVRLPLKTEVYLDKDGKEQVATGDTVILASGMRARSALADSFLTIDVPEAVEVGDCVRARTAEQATREGYYAAVKL